MPGTKIDYFNAPVLVCPDCGERSLEIVEITEPTADGEYKEIRACNHPDCSIGARSLVYIVRMRKPNT